MSVFAVFIGAVLKGVHLFFDNICHLTDTPHKKLCVLQDGRADIAVSVAGHQCPHLVLQPFPTRRFRRQNIVHAFDGKQFFSHVFFQTSEVARVDPKRFSM